jgi:hypothetical protein
VRQLDAAGVIEYLGPYSILLNATQELTTSRWSIYRFVNHDDYRLQALSCGFQRLYLAASTVTTVR